MFFEMETLLKNRWKIKYWWCLCAAKITKNDCEHYYNHCVRYYVECAVGKPLRGDGNEELRQNKTKQNNNTANNVTDTTDDMDIERKYDDENNDDEIDLTGTTRCDHRSIHCQCVDE